ncbi:MAG: glutamine synthetase [Burkholderiales bacterium]|nr:MAG: glutamine synthetase [Burkholderiales bacterium]
MSARADGFAVRCGVHDPDREAACSEVARRLEEAGIERVRLGWCDVHGLLRGKTLMPAAAVRALREGVGMVGTLMLKDHADRTAWRVFERGATDDIPAFAGAANLVLLPDPDSLVLLPWSPGTAWLRCQPWFQDGTPVPMDSRRVLQAALARLAATGHGLRVGLEVEFHVYRMLDSRPQLDPELAAWPGLPPAVEMIHPGYQLQGEAMTDMAEPVLRIVQQTAQDLGLPLQSLEIELGPSQIEAVFDATDALTAADQMVLFRNGVRQALRRCGYLATFMCRPPFPGIMSSGWHLHQSLVRLDTGANAFVRAGSAPGTHPGEASHALSDTGCHWLGGLLAHADALACLCTPTANGFGRFRPHALAPQAAVWGRDNRGAMLRVVGGAGDPSTRIENRLGEPAANPYLYMAAQVAAGLDGLSRRIAPPNASEDPYDPRHHRIPSTLGAALDALAADPVMTTGLGETATAHFLHIKRAEAARHAEAEDKLEFDRREYFSRI